MTPTLTTEDSAVVTVKVTGEVAEIEKYRFDYKLDTDTTWQTASTRVSNYRTYGYTYNDLEKGKTYNLRVTATDAEGEIYSSEVQTVTATYNGWYEPMNPEDSSLSGKTVDYIPDVRSIIPQKLLGYSGGNALTTETDSGWNIWGEDTNNLYLIAARPIKADKYQFESLSLELPWLIDAASVTCYLNKSYKGAMAKGVKIEDIIDPTKNEVLPEGVKRN